MKGQQLVFGMVAYFLLCGASHAQGDQSLPQVNKKFLITLHITQDSLGNPSADAAAIEEIKSAIKSSSGMFSPIGISFEVGEVYYIDNWQFNEIGLVDELADMSSKYDKPSRINVYAIKGYVDELEGGCGIAGDNLAGLGAMYMAVGCINSGSFSHETGHFFGLAHTFGTSSVLSDDFQTTDELADGSNCDTAGDGICDTPADPYIPNDETGIVWIEDCAFIYDEKDSNGDYYDPDIGNIMSYYFEGCDCGLHFSDGQYRKMAETYYKNPNKW